MAYRVVFLDEMGAFGEETVFTKEEAQVLVKAARKDGYDARVEVQK